jgi:hypothetical protein
MSALQPFPTLTSDDPSDLMDAINQIARIRLQDIANSMNQGSQNNTNSGLLNGLTNTTGVLLNGVTATTQAIGDNSAKIATDAFVNASGYLGSGFVNKFRNASFNIAQRGISGTVTTGNANYTLDGWIVGATGATVSWIRIYNSGPSAFLSLTGATSMTDTFIRQRIESYDAAALAGNSVTVQFFISNQSGASITPSITVKHPTAQDNWSSTVTDVSAVPLQTIANTAAGNIAYTFSSSANTFNGLEITIDFGASLNSANSIFIRSADIRATPGVPVGLNGNPPIVESRPIFAELAYCQRYLAAFGDIAGVVGVGAATSTSASGYAIPFKVPMRIAPTGLTVKTVGDFEIQSYSATDVAALTAMTLNSASSSNQNAFITTTVAATPLTSGTSYNLYTKTALAGNLIFTGAEL